MNKVYMRGKARGSNFGFRLRTFVARFGRCYALEFTILSGREN